MSDEAREAAEAASIGVEQRTNPMDVAILALVSLTYSVIEIAEALTQLLATYKEP